MGEFLALSTPVLMMDSSDSDSEMLFFGMLALSHVFSCSVRNVPTNRPANTRSSTCLNISLRRCVASSFMKSSNLRTFSPILLPASAAVVVHFHCLPLDELVVLCERHDLVLANLLTHRAVVRFRYGPHVLRRRHDGRDLLGEILLILLG